MPRQARARLLPPDGCLHIICRGNNRQIVFQSSLDFNFYYLINTLGTNVEQRQEQYRTFVIDSDIEKRLNQERFIGTREFVEQLEDYFDK